MAEYLTGSFTSNADLAALSSYLAERGQNFRFGISSGSVHAQSQTLGLVVAGEGQIFGETQGLIRANDLVFLDPGEYSLSPTLRMLTVTGQGLFQGPAILRQEDFPIEQSTLGGVRRMVKDGNGHFNIDVHTIWVNGRQVKIPHYHTRLFELYLTMEGHGEILLSDADRVDEVIAPELIPGGFVVVAPKTIHKAQGTDLLIQVMGIPAFYHQDAYPANL